MNEPTRTNRLRLDLRAKLDYAYVPEMSKMITDILLQTCKEAGLRFVPDFFDSVTFQSGHYDGIMKAIAQIEEIEVK